MNARALTQHLTKNPLVRYHTLPFLFALLIGGLVLFDRRPPIQESTLAGYAEPMTIQRLDELVIRWSVMRNRYCPSEIHREIVDSVGKLHKYEPVVGKLSRVTGADNWTSRLKLPPDIAWGAARLRSTINFRCGTLGAWLPIKVNSPEVEFVVVPDRAAP